MADYTAEDGLKLLDFLGLHDINSEETEIFRGRWEAFYKDNGKDLVKTTRSLYVYYLPFVHYGKSEDENKGMENERKSFMLARSRSSAFSARLKISGLDKEKLNPHVPLDREYLFERKARRLYGMAEI